MLSPQKSQRSCTPKAPLALQPNVTCATLGPRRVALRLSPTAKLPGQAGQQVPSLSSQIGGVARLEAIPRIRAGRAGGASFSIRRGLSCTHGQLSQSVKALWAVWGVHLLLPPLIGRSILLRGVHHLYTMVLLPCAPPPPGTFTATVGQQEPARSCTATVWSLLVHGG